MHLMETRQFWKNFHKHKNIFMITWGGILGNLKKAYFKTCTENTFFQHFHCMFWNIPSSCVCHVTSFTGHVTDLSVGADSLGHDVAGTTRDPTAPYNSKVVRVVLKFYIQSSSVKSQTIISQKPLIRGHSHAFLAQLQKHTDVAPN